LQWKPALYSQTSSKRFSVAVSYARLRRGAMSDLNILHHSCSGKDHSSKPQALLESAAA